MRELIATRWGEIEPLLDMLLELAPEERDARLERDCADPELRAAVLHLLALDARDDNGIDQLAHEFSECANFEGQYIGPYRIGRTLGEGGMGTVFLATRQTEEFIQQVALKLLRVGLFSSVQQEQFRREQQIHARLQHPHIARIYDSGISVAGVPYFAMEFVDGTPLTEYCDSHGLGIDARLRLFATICEAVAYAHQNLVVHRDLKPSNILISQNAEPKLLDFGIAKLLAGADAGGEPTRTDLRQLTPGYAAPEQFDGGAITTATDVYALGVLLCELLTGARPAAAGTDAAQARVVNPGRDAAAAAMRGLSPQALTRRLRGDLESIVGKALQNDPQRRYPGAMALREDIARHLDGKPIGARPDAAAYRLRKFIQRHKIGFAASLTLAATLIAASVFSLKQANMAERAAARATSEADRANAVKKFLLDLFESSAPGAEQHAETADEILAKGLEQARSNFSAQPDLQVEVLRTIGDIQHRRGEYDAARAPLEQALAIARQQFGAGDTRTLDAVVALSRLDEARDEYTHAQSILQAAIDAYYAQAGGESVALAHALQQLGVMRLRQRQVDPAVQLEERALAMFRHLLPVDSVEINEAMIGLGDALDHAGQSERAVAMFREVVARTRRTYGDTHVLTAEALSYLAAPLRDLGHVDEAESALREAVATNSKVYVTPNMHAADALYELGKTLRMEGKAAASEAVFRQELAIEQQLFPDGHPNIATTLSNLAHARALQGNYAQAEQLQRDSLAMDLRLRGEDHPYIAQGRASLAQWLIREGNLDEASRLLAEATAADHQRYGDSHPQIATDSLIAAELAAARGDPNDAISLTLTAVDMFERELPPRSTRLLTAQLDAGRVLLAARAFAQAQTLFAAAVAGARAGTPVVALYLAQALAGLGDAQAGQVRRDQAIVSWREALQSLALAPEPDAALADQLAARINSPPR